MERLREQVAVEDPAVAKAARLARSVSVPEASLGMKERIWARLFPKKEDVHGWKFALVVAMPSMFVFALSASSLAARDWIDHQVQVRQAAQRKLQHSRPRPAQRVANPSSSPDRVAPAEAAGAPGAGEASSHKAVLPPK